MCVQWFIILLCEYEKYIACNGVCGIVGPWYALCGAGC